MMRACPPPRIYGQPVQAVPPQFVQTVRPVSAGATPRAVSVARPPSPQSESGASVGSEIPEHICPECMVPISHVYVAQPVHETALEPKALTEFRQLEQPQKCAFLRRIVAELEDALKEASSALHLHTLERVTGVSVLPGN